MRQLQYVHVGQPILEDYNLGPNSQRDSKPLGSSLLIACIMEGILYIHLIGRHARISTFSRLLPMILDKSDNFRLPNLLQLI